MAAVTVGLIVNPVAGMGGRVGLKGTDGATVLQRARALGADPEAPAKARRTLQALADGGAEIHLCTAPGLMGEEEARQCDLPCEVCGPSSGSETTREDTLAAARAMEERGVDLLLFAGGDGTARDIYEALGLSLPVLGIPSGVKIHSAVFATTPERAGELAGRFAEKRIALRSLEVMDIDEEAFRKGEVRARLYGYLRVPYERRFVQGLKAGSSPSEEGSQAQIASFVTEELERERLYLVGSGTTPRAIMRQLGLSDTLLGVDAVRSEGLVGSDLNEQGILSILEGEGASLIVTPVGGQGYLFGRGNQQLSPAVLRRVTKRNILVVATPGKLHALAGRPLLVDTGERSLDEALSGYIRVITGYRETTMYPVSPG
ncbi:MAG: ATP-NAD kinase family protein [Synergistales bacterium]|nr:ATP-NAD kinase family protein [Synergistales bacterium]